VLGRENTKWTAVGYIVNSASPSPLYPLYRFYAETNIATPPIALFGLFAVQVNQLFNGQVTSMSYIMDGVVHLRLRAYDTTGTWINNAYQPYTNAMNTLLLAPANDEAQIYMFSNTVPAAVELELGVLEDGARNRAESLSVNPAAQANYLAQQAGRVHLFRQRVTIPNVDPTAYQ
jgi:hypothetical protein